MFFVSKSKQIGIIITENKQFSDLTPNNSLFLSHATDEQSSLTQSVLLTARPRP